MNRAPTARFEGTSYRFTTSAPAFKAHISQSQAERARGPILPMEPAHSSVTTREGIATGLVLGFGIGLAVLVKAFGL